VEAQAGKGGVQVCLSGVDTGWGADSREGGKRLPLGDHKGDGGQAGLDGEDARRGQRETGGGPPLHLGPEGFESGQGAYVG